VFVQEEVVGRYDVNVVLGDRFGGNEDAIGCQGCFVGRIVDVQREKLCTVERVV